ncbi:glycosyltransferase [Candidatus Uhrbacteria bacterium]|nr:glycosyltransferase [Candidatus Uhrbacteria bacterium]
MKPNQPQHFTTSLHRVPAGLRGLDLLIERITLYADKHPQHAPQILITGDETASYALPIAALGFSVVNLHASETNAKNCQARAKELGVEINCKTLRLSEEQTEKFDIIINPNLPADTVEAEEALIAMRAAAKRHGFILIKAQGAGKRPYNNLLELIRKSKLRVYSSANAAGPLARRLKQNSKQNSKRNSKFHLLDTLDGLLAMLAPRNRAQAWVMECHPQLKDKLVAYILPTLQAGGGAERLVMQLSERLPEHGFEAHIFANVRGGALENLLQEKNIAYTLIERRGIFSRFINICKLKRHLQDLSPDIVHTHLLAADIWGRFSARLAKCGPIVTTLHNVKMEYGRLGVWVMRLTKTLTARYIAISDDVAGFLENTLKVKPQKITTIQNGVEVSKIKRRINRPFHDVPKLLFVGRLEPQKNPDILLHALANVRGSWELAIYGQGSMEHELKYMADSLGILPRIYWQGIAKDMHHIYAEHDLFIMPSAWEGFGLVAVEAAVAGIPMIVSDIPVMRELFADSVKMSAPGNVASLTQAIEDCLDNSSQAVARAQNLASADFTKYSIDKMTEEHVKLYNSLMKNHG